MHLSINVAEMSNGIHFRVNQVIKPRKLAWKPETDKALITHPCYGVTKSDVKATLRVYKEVSPFKNPIDFLFIFLNSLNRRTVFPKKKKKKKF